MFEKEIFQPRRSVLCIPASNQKALAKLNALDCDSVIFDLEDAVASEMKDEARAYLAAQFDGKGNRGDLERIIRINGLDTPYGANDVRAVIDYCPDIVLLPKVEEPEDIQAVVDQLDEAGNTKTWIWAMIETPKGVLNAAAVARAMHTDGGRLTGFVVGLNDLRKATKVPFSVDRRVLHSWLMQVMLAARAYGLVVIDAVSNNFRDIEQFAAECEEGRMMGFDGKMLIHPAQIEPANIAFGPSVDDIREAKLIVSAFARPEAEGQGAININGQMVERLHLEEAEMLLARVRLIEQRKAK